MIFVTLTLALAQPPVTDAIHSHLMDREYCSARSPGLSLVGHPEADHQRASISTARQRLSRTLALPPA